MAYPVEVKARGVALGRVMGAPAAGKYLHVSAKQIRRWMEAAGDDADLLDIDPTEWAGRQREAMELVRDYMRQGRVSPTQAVVIAGVATRNVRYDPKPEPEADPDAAHVARIRKEYGQPGLDLLTSAIRLWLARARTAGPVEDAPGDSSPEVVAYVDDWELECLRIASEDYPDLETAKAAVDAELHAVLEAERLAVDVQIAQNERTRDQAALDRLLARAHDYLGDAA